MKGITHEDIRAHRERGPWRALEGLASTLVRDASHRAGRDLKPLLGGGTRLMLALEHRVSDDIDLFIRDPQWINYLSPRLNDLLDDRLRNYDEAAGSLKLHFDEGEIDFVVAMSLLDLPEEHETDSVFALEPIAEVLAKKLFYRGWALTARDLYDWWAVEVMRPGLLPVGAIATLLAGRLPQIEDALERLRRGKAAQQAWQDVRAPTKPAIDEAIGWGLREIGRYRSEAANSDARA